MPRCYVLKEGSIIKIIAPGKRMLRLGIIKSLEAVYINESIKLFVNKNQLSVGIVELRYFITTGKANPLVHLFNLATFKIAGKLRAAIRGLLQERFRCKRHCLVGSILIYDLHLFLNAPQYSILPLPK